MPKKLLWITPEAVGGSDFDQLVGRRFASQFEYLADFGMIVIYNWLDGSPELDQLDTIIKQSSHASAVRSFSFHIYDDKPERLARFGRSVWIGLSRVK